MARSPTKAHFQSKHGGKHVRKKRFRSKRHVVALEIIRYTFKIILCDDVQTLGSKDTIVEMSVY